MGFSWIIGVVYSLLMVCIIVWGVIATKRKAFTFKEIGIISLENSDKERDEIDVLLFSPYLSVSKLSILRGMIGLFCFIILIIRNIEGPTNGLQPMAFYTVWGWTLLTIYFISLSIIGFMNVGKCYTKCINQKRLNCLRIGIWIIFECLCSMVLLTDLTVWIFNANQQFKVFTDFIMHSVNFILIYLELIINGIPLPNIHHSIFAIILGSIYNIFIWIIIAIFQRPFPYQNLDYTNHINAILIIVINIILFICWIIAYGFKRINEKKHVY